MKLSELDPVLKNDILRFDCPVCSLKGNSHSVRICILPRRDEQGNGWAREGEFPDTLTLRPSINVGCWHGNIVAGEILPA